MDSSNLFPTKWLSADDVGDREVEVTVENVKKETVGDDPKLVLYYVGFDKGHVLNKTNWKKIKDRYGAETDNWLNKKLILYTALVPFKGEDVPALRLKIPEPKNESAAPAAPEPSAVDQAVEKAQTPQEEVQAIRE
jgi:hypothetical protein